MPRAVRLLWIVPIGVLAVWLSDAGVYGWTLYAILPVLAGALGAGFLRPASAKKAMLQGAGAAGLGLFAFLIIGIEGLICVFMAAPLALPLGALGGWISYQMEASRKTRSGTTILALLPLATLGFDFSAQPEVFQITSSIEVAATPEEVWPHIVSFSPLPEPDEWFFRAGIAYPTETRIEGSGVGARRYCDLSTGSAVETVDVWDPPRRLRFQVHETPPPMRELSFYDHVDPEHLHGYMLSKQGEFRLTELPGGRTRIDGTSWYQHGLWPSQYWRLWSDALGRQIQMRVLTNIKARVEN